MYQQISPTEKARRKSPAFLRLGLSLHRSPDGGSDLPLTAREAGVSKLHTFELRRHSCDALKPSCLMEGLVLPK